MGKNDLKSEVSKYDPPAEEKRKDAFISLYYLVIFLLFGMPMWYLTTTTYRATLPISEISEFAQSKIIIAIKVNIINFDGKIELDHLFDLQDKLLHEFYNSSSANGQFVKFKYTGYVRHAVKDEAKIFQYSQSLSELDQISSNLDYNAIHVFLVPEDTHLLPHHKDGLIRSKVDRNVVLVRAVSLDQVRRVISNLVTNLLARNDDLNVVYQAALDVPEKESLNKIPARVRAFLTRARTASKYEWAFSLIVPNPLGGPSTEWSFPRMEHLYLEPLIRKLAPFVSVSVTSQILYKVRLDRIWPSKARGQHRIYSREDLTHVVNGIETYVGANNALHFISYLASGPGEPELHLEGGPKGSDAFTVPRWGGVVIMNNVSLPVDGNALMGIFLPQIWALIGLSKPAIDASLSLEEFDASGVATWQLHAWLRERTVENLAINQVTLQSIAVLLDKVVNMVIRDDVATHIRTATRLSQNALDALRSTSDDNALQIAFLSSKQALEAAETAFFHPSLLELLYFQDDQKIGIYIPLFVPVIFPVFLAALKAKPFLPAIFKAKTD